MLKKGLVALRLMVFSVLTVSIAGAQNLGLTEFPIAVGEESAFAVVVLPAVPMG